MPKRGARAFPCEPTGTQLHDFDTARRQEKEQERDFHVLEQSNNKAAGH
jgi:hypothetical protein